MKLKSLLPGMFAAIFVLTIFSAAVAEEVNNSQLFKRNQLYFLASSDTPFTGTADTYYKNGKIAEKRPYYEGKLNGLYESWYPNGQLREKAHYLQGALNGTYTIWYDSGQKLMDMSFNEGEKEGACNLWFEDGKKWIESNFKNDLPDGIFAIWHKDGKLNFKVEISGNNVKTLYSSSEGVINASNCAVYLATIQRWQNKIISLQYQAVSSN